MTKKDWLTIAHSLGKIRSEIAAWPQPDEPAAESRKLIHYAQRDTITKIAMMIANTFASGRHLDEVQFYAIVGIKKAQREANAASTKGEP